MSVKAWPNASHSRSGGRDRCRREVLTIYSFQDCGEFRCALEHPVEVHARLADAQAFVHQRGRKSVSPPALWIRR